MSALIRFMSCAIFTLCALTLNAQPYPVSYLPLNPGNISIGGYPAREAPAAATLSTGVTVIVYTANDAGNNASSAIYAADNASGTSQLNFGNVRSTGLSGNFNPALSSIGNTLYIAYRSGSGQVFFASSTDTGHTWASPTQLGLPAISVDPAIFADATTNRIYVGGTDYNTYAVILCSFPIGSPGSLTCYRNPDNQQAGYSPAIARYSGNGNILVAFAQRSGSHCLYFYDLLANSSSLSSNNYLGCNEQASASPSLLQLTPSEFIVAFRTNDSSSVLRVRYTENSAAGFPYAASTQSGIRGGPSLVSQGAAAAQNTSSHLLQSFQESQ